MTKMAGSGYISQRHGSADPDPDPDQHQNVMDPQHWIFHLSGERELRRPEILHLLLLSFLPNKRTTHIFFTVQA